MNELSKVPTPPRMRRKRAVASGINWQPADEVPGAVMPPQPERDHCCWNGR